MKSMPKEEYDEKVAEMESLIEQGWICRISDVAACKLVDDGVFRFLRDDDHVFWHNKEYTVRMTTYGRGWILEATKDRNDIYRYAKYLFM
jgi:hypothetical protein